MIIRRLETFVVVACVCLQSCSGQRTISVGALNQLLPSNTMVFAVREVSPTNYSGLQMHDLEALRITGAQLVGRLPLRDPPDGTFIMFENVALEIVVYNSIRRSLLANTSHALKGEWVLALRPTDVYIVESLSRTTNATLRKLRAQHVWVEPEVLISK